MHRIDKRDKRRELEWKDRNAYLEHHQKRLEGRFKLRQQLANDPAYQRAVKQEGHDDEGNPVMAHIPDEAKIEEALTKSWGPAEVPQYVSPFKDSDDEDGQPGLQQDQQQGPPQAPEVPTGPEGFGQGAGNASPGMQWNSPPRRPIGGMPPGAPPVAPQSPANTIRPVVSDAIKTVLSGGSAAPAAAPVHGNKWAVPPKQRAVVLQTLRAAGVDQALPEPQQDLIFKAIQDARAGNRKAQEALAKRQIQWQ